MLRTNVTPSSPSVETGECELVRRLVNDCATTLIDKEWLVTNGLGGYASGTIAGKPQPGGITDCLSLRIRLRWVE